MNGLVGLDWTMTLNGLGLWRDPWWVLLVPGVMNPLPTSPVVRRRSSSCCFRCYQRASAFLHTWLCRAFVTSSRCWETSNDSTESPLTYPIPFVSHHLSVCIDNSKDNGDVYSGPKGLLQLFVLYPYMFISF